ncbi:hypothetical protein MTO96_015084 [Rhipicephalus appendiculatus]
MFLVASFLASSAPIDIEVRGYPFRMRSLGRRAMLGAWMLGILPLSAYYRSELTSRLSVQVPPEVVDTLGELEAALDKNEIEPCILKDGCLHAMVEDEKHYHGNRSLDLKLMRAFNRRPKDSRLVFDNQEGCLRCADRRGFACFLCGLSYCTAPKVRQDYVESREPLNVALVTTPLRKGNRLARPYHQLLQRLFETALHPFGDKRRHCREADSRTRLPDTGDIEEEVSQVFGLSAFFTIFMALMGTAFVVFCFELAFGSRLTHA